MLLLLYYAVLLCVTVQASQWPAGDQMSSKELLAVCADEHPRKVQMLKVLTVGMVSDCTENLGCRPQGWAVGMGRGGRALLNPHLIF